MSDSQESQQVVKTGPEATLQSTKSPRTISVKFFNTRNLSIVVFGLVLIVALVKADQKDIPKIVETIVSSEHVGLIGWIVAGLILCVAIVFIKLMCHIYDKEIERLVRERDQLQKILLHRNGGEK